MIPQLLWVLLWAGGVSSLSGHLDFEAYFTSQNIPYTAQSLTALLQEEKVDAALIDGWVLKLGADEFKDREMAGQALAEIGETARAVLEGATRSQDPEIAVRSFQLLEKLPKLDKDLTRTNRELALFALGELRDPATRPMLEDFAGREASREQWMARQALAAWDRKEDAAAPMTPSDSIWSAFPADAAAVARFTPTAGDNDVKTDMRQSNQTQSQLRDLFLAVGELHFRRITIAVGADSLKKENPERAWVAALMEGEMDPILLGAWLTAQDFAESEVEGLKHYQRNSLRIVAVNAQMLLVLLVKGEGGPKPGAILAGLRGKDTTTGLSAKLREQLPSGEPEPPAWVRFAAPADFESELPWLRGVRRAELNAQRKETVSFSFEVSGWAADEADVPKVLAGVEALAAQRVGRIRNPGHPIMVPVAQFWRSLLPSHEAEKVMIKGEMPQEYFRSLHQQSERANRPDPNNDIQNIRMQGMPFIR